MKYVFVLIGSGLGGAARYLLSSMINSVYSYGFPLGTLFVNLLGCFTVGFLTGLLEDLAVSPNLRLFIFIGVLGGFTTFSTFGLETFKLLKDAEWLAAIMNLLLNCVIGVILVVCGYVCSRLLIKALK